MRKLHKKPLVLAAAAIALTGSLTVGFTETKPHEEVDENGKHVTISNVGDYDCFVRVRAFAPVELSYNAPDGGWTDGGDGYWYYNDVLQAGQTTEKELNITYKFPSGDQKPEEFNVVVIQECTPILYDEDGNAYADWDRSASGWERCGKCESSTDLLQ